MTIQYKTVQRTASPGKKGGARTAYPMVTNRHKLTNEAFCEARQELVHPDFLIPWVKIGHQLFQQPAIRTT